VPNGKKLSSVKLQDYFSEKFLQKPESLVIFQGLMIDGHGRVIDG
jgi:hypothetical protein